jgi:nitrate/nitrite transporter NarK
MRTASIWPVFCFWCSGLLLRWFGGWAEVRYQYSLVSDAVLPGMLLCFGISLLSLALARRNLPLCWKVASFISFLMSLEVSGHSCIGPERHQDAG